MKASDFRLRSYTGEDVRLADLRGKALALTFLDAQCKDACPIIAAVVPRAQALLTPSERGRVAFVAISTDPAEDTPGGGPRVPAPLPGRRSARLPDRAGARGAQELAVLRRARLGAQRLGQPAQRSRSDLQTGRRVGIEPQCRSRPQPEEPRARPPGCSG